MTAKADILRAIRLKCLDCSAGQPSEVRECRLTACALWPYRLGSDPVPGKPRGCAKPPLHRGEGAATGLGVVPHPLLEPSSEKTPLSRGDFGEGGMAR